MRGARREPGTASTIGSEQIVEDRGQDDRSADQGTDHLPSGAGVHRSHIS
jgi:hypothetical protein